MKKFKDPYRNIKIIYYSGIVGAIMLATWFVLIIAGQLTTSIVCCKVIDLQQQQIISGAGNNIKTEMRYLIIGNDETFISETSFFNGKFNNSDIFFRLKKDSIYVVKVCGFGKTFFSDYRNIIEIEP